MRSLNIGAGRIITYADARGSPPFRRAVATGDQVTDPQTGRCWLPVIRTDLLVDLVDPDSVIDIAPPSS
jgi:hypothetical protein